MVCSSIISLVPSHSIDRWSHLIQLIDRLSKSPQPLNNLTMLLLMTIIPPIILLLLPLPITPPLIPLIILTDLRGLELRL